MCKHHRDVGEIKGPEDFVVNIIIQRKTRCALDQYTCPVEIDLIKPNVAKSGRNFDAVFVYSLHIPSPLLVDRSTAALYQTCALRTRHILLVCYDSQFLVEGRISKFSCHGSVTHAWQQL